MTPVAGLSCVPSCSAVVALESVVIFEVVLVVIVVGTEKKLNKIRNSK